MGLNILLVNPNQLKTPPVIPIGLEYIKEALNESEHGCDILDLCFSTNPFEELKTQLNLKNYDIVGFTIRNIDSCIFFNNEFFLPQIKELIALAKILGHKVILGGAGFTAMPNEIMEYLEADYGIIGPGEKALLGFLDHYQKGEINNPLIDGWKSDLIKEFIPIRATDINYDKYISNEGIVGFKTHSGCDGKCPYCMEANTKLSYRNINSVVQEIENIVGKGFNHFHLCDSEFNNDLEYSLKFCQALNKKNLSMKWTLYMKPTPYNEELYQLLKQSNAYLITLTVDSDENIQRMNDYDYNDLKIIIGFCTKYKIDLAIDLLIGYPKESLNSVKKMLDFFKKNRPTKVGISFYYRLLDKTILAKSIRNDKNLQDKLTKPYNHDESFLEPIFYAQLNQDKVLELIGNDDLFHIAGITLGVNYQL